MIRLWSVILLVIDVALGGVALAQDVTITTTTTTSDGNTLTTVEQGDNAGSSITTTTSSGTSHSESNATSSGGGISFGFSPPAVHKPAPRASGGNSCSVPDNHQCRGCAISCPADKQASCKGGDRGIFIGDNDGLCPTDAKCKCT